MTPTWKPQDSPSGLFDGPLPAGMGVAYLTSMSDATDSLTPAPAAAKRSSRRVPLIVKDTIADEVRVTGDFTDWTRDGIRLSHDGDGLWRTVLCLEPGEHQYRLLVDGEWNNHAEAIGHADNPFGSKNCVLKVV